MHISVLPNELITGMDIKNNGLYVDATFGAGGHSLRLLEANKTAKLIALDRDENAIAIADKMKQKFGDRFEFKNLLFSDIDKASDEQIDGIMYDIGISSMQVDEAERGFSFNKSGPLSMEMGLNNISAEDIVNGYTEEKLANLIYKYGDERKSRIIAKKIVEHRQKERIVDTLVLGEIIRKTLGKYNDDIHPATRTFQALRIAVNNELDELEISLEKAIKKLKSGGRICVITFHSLEDKIVKNIFNKYSGKQIIDFDRNYGGFSDNVIASETLLKLITKKPIIPTDLEIKNNIRARSAKLRIAEKI
jgi:16S rRNA (cytosine1402-N4)-methyltransferase